MGRGVVLPSIKCRCHSNSTNCKKFIAAFQVGIGTLSYSMSNPGPPPYNGDDNRSTGILADAILVTTISCVALSLRFATRIWIVRSIGWVCTLHPLMEGSSHDGFRMTIPYFAQISASPLAQSWSGSKSTMVLADISSIFPTSTILSPRNTPTQTGSKHSRH